MSGLNLSRRQFFCTAAAASTFPLLGGCQEVKDTPHYQLGYALGQEYSTEIWAFLGRLIPQLLGFLSPVESSGQLASVQNQLDRIKAAARYYGFEQTVSVEKSSVNWDMVQVGLKTFGGLFSVQATLKEQSPNNYAKILGLADGSLGWVSRELFFLLQCMEVTGTIASWGGGNGACSALMLSADATTLGEPILAKNFDLNPVMVYGHILRRDGVPGGVQSLSMTMNMMPGAVSATNGKVAMSENWLYGTDLVRKYLPASCVIQDAIEACSTTQEVVEHFSTVECGGYFLMPVIDAKGEMALVQNTPVGKVILRPEDPYFVVTNHHQGVFPDYMQRLLNLLIPDSTYIRYNRITTLVRQKLGNGAKLSLEDIFDILSDHDPQPSDNSICRHAQHTVTVGSIVMLPASGRVHAALGNPCEIPFVEHALEK